jgi:hypothetical protein
LLAAGGDAPEKSKKDWISVKHNKKNSSNWQWRSFVDSLDIVHTVQLTGVKTDTEKV